MDMAFMSKAALGMVAAISAEIRGLSRDVRGPLAVREYVDGPASKL